jgi:hypothetical protein
MADCSLLPVCHRPQPAGGYGTIGPSIPTPFPEAAIAHDTLRAGDLTAVIGDNSAAGEHRAGYNGVWSLTHRTEPANLFVPAVAGLNLEHIFDGDKDDTDQSNKIFFEPRHSPMHFKKLSETEAELHQPPTPTFHLESWTRFRLTPPHYLDLSFRCRPTQHVFAHGYIGLFWASYINAPEDKSMYFRGGGLWQQLCTQRHNDASTVRHRDDRHEPKFSPTFRACLFRSFSPLRYDEPVYYGLFRKHILIVMFDRAEGVRFSHSPSGGGVNQAAQTSNPAWDFQYIIPRYEVLKEYGMHARVAYRERCDRAEVLRELAAWRAKR